MFEPTDSKTIEMMEIIDKVTDEKEILLETIDIHNRQIKELNTMKDDYIRLKQQNDCFKSALYLIVHTINIMNNQIKTERKIEEDLNFIFNISLNSIAGHSVKKGFEKEVEEGNHIAEELIKKHYSKNKFDWNGFP